MAANQPNHPYAFRRGLIESLYNGTDVFISSGSIKGGPSGQFFDNRLQEGWVHEKNN
jgi:hypothetical protein